jgi:CubicO group peptidase (beta-lactamase class C family)
VSTLVSRPARYAAAASLCICVVVMGMLMSPGAADAEVTFPESDAGKRAQAYIQAFNTGDESEVRTFMEANFTETNLQALSMEERMAMYQRLRSDLANLEPMRVTSPATDALTVVAQTGTGKWVEMRFAFEPEPPHKISRLGFRLLPEAPDLTQPVTPISEAEMVGELKAYLIQAVASDEFSGVVLVARDSTPIFREAYGLASKEYNAPNRMETRFNLGSINKYMTGIAIEQLAGKGLLSLDDTIGKYLPDYPNRVAADKITISQLLDMQSGIGDFFGERYEATPKDHIRDLADYLPLFADEPLLFEPGTNSRYSNGGYVVLGLIIEAVSGRNYYDYVRDNIYATAGMDGSCYPEADEPTMNVASGYTNMWRSDGQPTEERRNNIYTRPARGSSAGGGYSTADDLLRLVTALRAGSLGAPDATRQVREQGIAVAGGANGINAFLEVTPGDYVIVVLSNYDPPAAQRVGLKIEQLLERARQ